MGKGQDLKRLATYLKNEEGFVEKGEQGSTWLEKTIQFKNCELEITLNLDSKTIVMELAPYGHGAWVEMARTPATIGDWKKIAEIIMVLKIYDPQGD